MKIAVLGGGFAGLAASNILNNKGHEVTVFEQAPVPGGLASGFKEPQWGWWLERTYHHAFNNDKAIIAFARKVGHDPLVFRSPITASMVGENNYRIIPVDTPQDFLLMPGLALPDKVRAGVVLAFLKLSPFLRYYEKTTARDFLGKTQGERTWNVLWKELFKKKFGSHADDILASFIWARVHKRTKHLGYPNGGFQALANQAVQHIRGKGVVFRFGEGVSEVVREGGGFRVLTNKNGNEKFDAVVSTLPTPITAKAAAAVLPEAYLKKLARLRYLSAQTLVLETDKPILDRVYWLNVSSSNIPLMVVVQHTNLVDKKRYGGKHIAYIAWYGERTGPLFTMQKEEIVSLVAQSLAKAGFSLEKPIKSFLFRADYAQPIFDKEFLKNVPQGKTPAPGFFIANLDMSYPYDRGVNYAVEVGERVALFI